MRRQLSGSTQPFNEWLQAHVGQKGRTLTHGFVPLLLEPAAHDPTLHGLLGNPA